MHHPLPLRHTLAAAAAAGALVVGAPYATAAPTPSTTPTSTTPTPTTTTPAADPADNLGPNEFIDLDGKTKTLTGRVTFTNPRVEYIPDHPIHGPVLKITYDVSNESNGWAASLGTANWGDRDKGWYSTAEGTPMDFACDDFVPFAPKGHKEHKVTTCTQWREVTDVELAFGVALPDNPYYDVLFGQDWRTGIWGESPAEAYPATAVEAPKDWKGREHFRPADDGHGHHHGHDHDHAHDHGDGHDHDHGDTHDHDHGHDHAHDHGDGHDHDHGDTHDHDHGHDHAHDHDHDHGDGHDHTGVTDTPADDTTTNPPAKDTGKQPTQEPEPTTQKPAQSAGLLDTIGTWLKELFNHIGSWFTGLSAGSSSS